MRVVVVSSAGPADELVERLESWSGTTVDRVWTGDPHLRPPGRWADAGWSSIGGLPAGVVRAGVAAPLDGVALGLEAVARGAGPALVLAAGSVLVRRPIELPRDAVGVVARGAPPLDGLTPTFDDLARWGPYSTAAISAPPELAALLVRRLVAAGARTPAGPALAAALTGLPVVPLPGEVLGWPPATTVSAPSEQSDQSDQPEQSEQSEAAIVDLVHVDPSEPWHLDFGPVPARVRLSGRPDLDHAGGPTRAPAPRLPGGLEIDAVVAGLITDAIAATRRDGGPPPPDPWREPVAFVDWLESPAHPWEPEIGRYWTALWRARADLRAAFPDLDDADLGRFRQWTRDRARFEGTSPLLRAVAPRFVAPWPTDGRRAGGVDVVGHFGAEVSLGNVAERLVASLDAVGIPHRSLDLRRTGSPRREHGVDDVLGHDTVIVVANHDQVPPLLARHGGVLAGRRLVGYWHWDVEHVPARVAGRMAPFDQIWVLNEYTERSLAAVPGAPPVRSLPLPVPEPVPSSATRAELGLPVDRPVVLVTFDHLSVTERKNPLGAIAAFRRAFPEPAADGPVLVIKTANADQRWVEHERVRCAAMDRSDVVVVDRMLPKGDQMALVAHADVLLSLHRAEGLGLHLVEAMWLGTPTIATRYSGNLSFMDDDNSLLVDARMVPVERGEGFFPPEATWAEPDVDQAAGHLRRLLADRDLRGRLAAAGRATMERQPSFAEMGRTIAAWCGIEVT